MSGEVTHLKTVVVGDGAVGKTCMMMAYSQNIIEEEYIPTVFDNYSCHVLVDEKVIALSLWDTAGQEDYDRMRPLSYPGTDVFIIAFNLVSPASLNNVKFKWLPELKHHCPDVPIILVGNKADLRREFERKGRGQFVSTSEGEAVAKTINADGYFECSAINMEGLNELFDGALRAAINKRDAKRKAGKKKCTIL